MIMCHRAIGRSIKDCKFCRVEPWDREAGGGWLVCPEFRPCQHGQCRGVRWECDNRGECLIGNPEDDGVPHNDESYGTRFLSETEQRIMHTALRRSTRLIARGASEPSKSQHNSPAFASQFTGDICQDCGGTFMVRTGTCLTCQKCGSSSGGCS